MKRGGARWDVPDSRGDLLFAAYQESQHVSFSLATLVGVCAQQHRRRPPALGDHDRLPGRLYPLQYRGGFLSQISDGNDLP